MKFNYLRIFQSSFGIDLYCPDKNVLDNLIDLIKEDIPNRRAEQYIDRGICYHVSKLSGNDAQIFDKIFLHLLNAGWEPFGISLSSYNGDNKKGTYEAIHLRKEL